MALLVLFNSSSYQKVVNFQMKPRIALFVGCFFFYWAEVLWNLALLLMSSMYMWRSEERKSKEGIMSQLRIGGERVRPTRSATQGVNTPDHVREFWLLHLFNFFPKYLIFLSFSNHLLCECDQRKEFVWWLRRYRSWGVFVIPLCEN